MSHNKAFKAVYFTFNSNRLLSINKWDSKNAIFYTSDTAYTSNDLRKFLADILERSRHELDFDLVTKIQDIREKIVYTEIALRKDLGIYGIDFTKDMLDFSGKDFPPQKWW